MMLDSEVDSFLARVNGYWPTPEMTAEETLAWTETLTGRLRITPEEAVHVLLGEAETGRQWRPRAGEIIALVQALRRLRAIRQPPSYVDREDMPQLEEGTEVKTPAEHFAEARRRLARAQGPLVDDLKKTIGE